MARHIELLIVEDNPDDAELLVRELRSAGFDPSWERVDTEADYLAKLRPELDLILSDYSLPQFNGLRALELLQEYPGLTIPFIIISGTIGEETAVEAMRRGASDYLLKDRLGRLGAAVTRALQSTIEMWERRKLEVQFLEAQKMQVIGQLAGGVAHDFNNVLGVILGYSEFISQDLPPDHPAQRHADEIRHAAKRAGGLTRQLLIFSRKQTVEPILLDLNEAIQSVETMLRRLIDENVEMTIQYGEGLSLVKADTGYIWQVLMNLVVNARDAMPDGGKLFIGTEVRTGESVLTVADTGMGMSEEVKARLFEAFFTTKPVGKGTGLGLLTCQTIVRQCGGRIEVESAPGHGTTFTIFFPNVERNGTPVAEIDTGNEMPRGGTETVLIVEDEPSVRHLAQTILSGRGYHVLAAPNGQEALRVAREQGPVALVVTDVVMPRMGGKVMAEWLKEIYPDLRVLFTSGYTEDAISHLGSFHDGVDFLPKPYTSTGLARKVREMLDRPHHAAA